MPWWYKAKPRLLCRVAFPGARFTGLLKQLDGLFEPPALPERDGEVDAGDLRLVKSAEKTKHIGQVLLGLGVRGPEL